MVAKMVGTHLKIDEGAKRWCVVSNGYSGHSYKYSDIVSFELLEGVGKQTLGTTLMGAGTAIRALMGGASNLDLMRQASLEERNRNECSSLRVKIVLNNLQSPTVYIDFIKSQCSKSSNTYRAAFNNAQQCLSALQVMKNIADSDKAQATSVPVPPVQATPAPLVAVSVADELLKLKSLLDSGVLTADEFNNLKEELLKHKRPISILKDSPKLNEARDPGAIWDPQMGKAIKAVMDTGIASASDLQRYLDIGYPRAERLIEVMEQLGIVGPQTFNSSKPRDILMNEKRALNILWDALDQQIALEERAQREVE